MIDKQVLIRKLGDPFTYRKKVAEVMNYQDPQRVDKFLVGLERINGTRYWTADVVERILGAVER